MNTGVLRREDEPLLRGQGTFIDGLRDPALARAYHAVFVRSLEPHARLLSVDASDAVARPGVIGVFTAADIDIWPLPPRLPMMNKAMYRPMLADGVVRFVGEPIAIVVASSVPQGFDAAEAVIVEYGSLPAVVDLEDSQRDQVLLHPHANTNVSFKWTSPPFATDPFAACEAVVGLSVRHPRLTPAPIEPRAGAAVWTPEGRCVSWVCSQRPAGAKYVIECALGLEPGTVRAIAPDVGGGFGAKGGYGCYPEDVVLAWIARHLAHAVRWCETRSEAMVAMGHGRASTHRVRIGGMLDGTIRAYEAHALQDSGAYPSMGTFITNNLKNSGTGVYAIPEAVVSGVSGRIGGVRCGPGRSPGRSPTGRRSTQANIDDVVADVTRGSFYVAGVPSRSLTWADLGTIDATCEFKPVGGTFAFGACLAAVEVDTETGVVTIRSLVTVDDAGTLLQPMIAQGKVHGGLGLAVAAVLLEEMAYGDDGVPRTTNLADYPLISAAELPNFETHEMETPSPWNPLGVKGIGESGTVVGTPAIHSAAIDALSFFGVQHLDLPCTPERVWRAINDMA